MDNHVIAEFDHSLSNYNITQTNQCVYIIDHKIDIVKPKKKYKSQKKEKLKIKEKVKIKDKKKKLTVKRDDNSNNHKLKQSYSPKTSH